MCSSLLAFFAFFTFLPFFLYLLTLAWLYRTLTASLLLIEGPADIEEAIFSLSAVRFRVLYVHLSNKFIHKPISSLLFILNTTDIADTIAYIVSTNVEPS